VKLSSEEAKKECYKVTNVEFVVKIIPDEELNVFMDPIENLDKHENLESSSSRETREILRKILIEQDDAREMVAQDFSEIQRRHVLLLSNLKLWYQPHRKKLESSQLYEHFQRYLEKEFVDVKKFEDWVRNIKDYIERKRNCKGRLKFYRESSHRDWINDVLEEALDSIRKMKPKWNKLYVSSAERRELLSAFQSVDFLNRGDLMKEKGSKFRSKILQMSVACVPLVMYISKMRNEVHRKTLTSMELTKLTYHTHIHTHRNLDCEVCLDQLNWVFLKT